MRNITKKSKSPIIYSNKRKEGKGRADRRTQITAVIILMINKRKKREKYTIRENELLLQNT
jgi:hypothetical protein